MTRTNIAELIKNAKQYEADPHAISPDPAVPTRIRINLTQVIPYKNNPRKTRNPKFDEIKESIRASGLDTPPDVTREKPSDPYMIRNGGNTRLQILKELWDETGDPRFYEFDCIFHPWTNEFDLFIAHVKENELRGQMSFIERALAAKRAKEEFEKDDSEISVRDLAKKLSEKGWPIDQSNLGQLLYAEEILLPLLPKTFWDLGIGRDAVKQIRKVLDHCEKYWNHVAHQDDGDYQGILKKVCEKLDGDGFDVERLEYDLCGEIARAMGGGVSGVQSQIQALVEKIIQPEQLARPARVDEHTSVSIAEKPLKSIAKSKAKKITDNPVDPVAMVANEMPPLASTNPSIAPPTGVVSVKKPASVREAVEAVFTQPGFTLNYGFMHDFTEPQLREYLYHRVLDAFIYFPDDINPEWRTLEFISQFLVFNDFTLNNSFLGFDINLTNESLVTTLSQHQKYLGQIVYFLGMLPQREHITYVDYMLKTSGPLTPHDVFGLSLQYQLYRRVYLSYLSMHEDVLNEHHVICRAWTESEYIIGTLAMIYSEVSLI